MTHKTEWDLKQFYNDLDDPAIERDFKALEKLYALFEKKYKKRTDYLKNETKLLIALRDYNAFWEKVGSIKPLRYVRFVVDKNSADERAQALFSHLSGRAVAMENKILFFRLALGTLEKRFQKKVLANKAFSDYKRFLERVFKSNQYRLSEPEEKILNMMSLPSYGLWRRGVEKAIEGKTIEFKGKTMFFSEAAKTVSRLAAAEDRYALNAKVIEALKEVADFSTSELNAMSIGKKTGDELRGFKKPYSQRLFYDEISEKTVDELRSAVQKFQDISHDFHRIKAQLLGLKELRSADKVADIGKTTKKIPFEEAVSIVANTFEKFGPWYKDTFFSMLERGQIDVFPSKGKKGGGFCSSGPNTPTFILMNYMNDFDSIMTLAHEMGHAFHAELSKNLNHFYQGHATAVAEVASTFFECVVFEEAFKTLSKREQVVALHDRIQDDIGTIFRQIAIFDFEIALHDAVRTKGNISKEEIAALMNTCMQTYLGPACVLTKDDGYSFVSLMHIRLFFYVYSYAYGQLVSKALFQEYRKDKGFAKKIEQFLSSGSTKTPEQIFKDIGIDTAKPGFFEAGIKSIRNDLDRLESLAKEEKLI